jgi:hypothetical protein
MSDTPEVEPYYQRQAKDLTNMLFDKRFLADDLSREATDWLEDYLGFVMQSQCQSAVKAALLSKKVREKKQ